MNNFLEELGDRFQRLAAARGATIDTPRLDSALAQELLELARVVAHSEERRFAPLASYLAGVAAERLYRSRSEISGQEVVAYVREVRASLETA